jgi:hypothetical protein
MHWHTGVSGNHPDCRLAFSLASRRGTVFGLACRAGGGRGQSRRAAGPQVRVQSAEPAAGANLSREAAIPGPWLRRGSPCSPHRVSARRRVPEPHRTIRRGRELQPDVSVEPVVSRGEHHPGLRLVSLLVRALDHARVLRNVPRSSSSKAWRSCSWVFMTMGPYHATGS